MIDRRQFFSAGVGATLGVAGVKATERVGKQVEDSEWLDEYQSWYENYKPELELGHSARWKIQRYPGAKWVAIHRTPSSRLPGTDDIQFDLWQDCGLHDFDRINSILTNCGMEAVG